MRAKATISMLLLASCAAWGQSPQIISSTRQKLQTAEKTWTAQKGVLDSSAETSKIAGSQPTGKDQTAKKSTHSASDLNPSTGKDAAGTESGEEQLTESARRDASKRDPFISPVMAKVTGPGEGCTGGKKCLAVDQISLRGIVKSDSGMIAVVVNSANKAYFLRENDPVFNGFVTKITGDSVVFHETIQDAVGPPSERNVVKTIVTPVV